MKINFENNKIIKVNNIWGVINKYSPEKEYLIITPSTKLSDLFSFKKDNPLSSEVNKLIDGGIEEFVDIKRTTEIISKINFCFDDLLQLSEDKTKLLKVLLEINPEIFISNDNLRQVIDFINRNIKKFVHILLIGFDDLNIIEREYENLNIYVVTEEIIGLVTWENIEMLVLEDRNDYFEIDDKDKLLNWLEMKVKSVLSIHDIDTFLKGEINNNTLSISRAFRKLK